MADVITYAYLGWDYARAAGTAVGWWVFVNGVKTEVFFWNERGARSYVKKAVAMITARGEM